MKKINFKKLLPHLIAIILFAAVAMIYCKPALEGKELGTHDIAAWKGMAQQSFEVKEKTGQMPLWTNSTFGGMPAYQIAYDSRTNIGQGFNFIQKILSLGLNEPASFFFLACICFYILCLIAGANAWVAILGAISYAYCTYDPVIIVAGHNSKMASLDYAPLVIGGLILLFQRKYLMGFALTSLATAILIGQNHLQIVYYVLIIAVIMVVANLINAFKEKTVSDSIKSSLLGLAAGLIGLGVSAATILPTYEYAKETMRGGASQLTLDKNSLNKTKGGLDKDYALQYSFGKMETFTVMVPGLFGGSNGGNEHGSSAKMVEKFAEMGVPEENALGAVNNYSYWGGMSSESTSGPAYLGAVICFLFIFALFYLKSWHKWWIVTASILAILLAWGSSFKGFNYFMLDHLPFYGKFRAPSMAMVITQLCVPLLAVLGVSKLVIETDRAMAWKKLRVSVIATGVIMAILAVFYFTADYTGKGDTDIRDNFKQSFMQQVPPGQQPPPQVLAQADEGSKALMKALREDRKSETGGDLLRTFILIALAVILLGLFIKKYINALVLSLGLIALSAYDLLAIDYRYLYAERYHEADEVAAEFNPSTADLEILKDADHANFRVFNQSPNYRSEAMTSYHHNSIGGYSPAKLGLYQDIMDHQIDKGNMRVLDMLNTKYIIMQDRAGKQIVRLNPDAYGNCWLVKGIKFVGSPNEEMLALDSTDLKDIVVISDKFKSLIREMPNYDSTAFIRVDKRENDKITYNFSAARPQFAVLSEIYYSAGWKAFIDGQKTDYFKVDYALRGLYVPAGKHSIEFRFDPSSVSTGRTITIWSSILIYLVIVLSLVLYFRKKP